MYNLALESSVIQLGEGSLGMTMCQVPVVVSTTQGAANVEVVFADGSTQRILGLIVDRENSAKVFARSGEIRRIHAYVPEAALAPEIEDA